MSEENIELHRRWNEAFNTRDVDACLAYCDPEIELHSAVTGPGPAEYHGHSGVRRWHREIAEAFGGEIRLEPEAFFDCGEHTISYHVLHGRGQQSGADVTTRAAHLCRWRNGRIVYFQGYLQREDAFRDLGVSIDELEEVAPRGDTAGTSDEKYLLADQPSELERLQLQSRVWEPSGRELLSKIDGGSGARALDVGCGALGWLRILAEWVGPSGQVVGTDIDESLIDAARSFLEGEGISNAELLVDDLFDSKLDPQSFDLVHARYVIAPLGRGPEQVASHQRLLRPGGSLVLEEWDLGSWHFNPPAPAAERLIRLLSDIFAALGGEAGRVLPELLRDIGIEQPDINAHVIALEPGHPYLRLPLQFSVALESRLLERLSDDELASLRDEAERELAEPGRWGTTFTLIQGWGPLPL